MNEGWSAVAIVGASVFPFGAFAVLTVVFCVAQIVKAVADVWESRARRH